MQSASLTCSERQVSVACVQSPSAVCTDFEVLHVQPSLFFFPSRLVADVCDGHDPWIKFVALAAPGLAKKTYATKIITSHAVENVAPEDQTFHGLECLVTS